MKEQTKFKWGGCYTIDEKMGNTYIHHQQANTLAQRDYKMPQCVVIYEDSDDEKDIDRKEILRMDGR